MNCKFLNIVFYTVLVILILYPLVYWVANPTLTQMELLGKFWQCYLATVLLVLVKAYKGF